MLELALSILFSSLIFIIFKLFIKFKVVTLFAIVINYIVACLVGLYFYKEPIILMDIPHKGWFLGTLALGFLFILVFNLMARTSQKLGVSVASVATKMSLVIPVVFGLLLYKETLSPLKIVGILLALAAVYFVSVKKKRIDVTLWAWLLPLLVFLGSGIIDTSIKYLEETSLSKNEFPLFSASIFGCAAIFGMVYLMLYNIKEPVRINARDILGGISLGIPNFFSIYFLLGALQSETLNSASVFTINNVAIVMLTTLMGIFFFQESISVKNWAGIVMAVVSIFLVAFF